MDILELLKVLYRRKWAIVITLVVAVATSVIGTSLIPRRYEASTTLRLATAISGSLSSIDYEITYADRLMNTYAAIATSGPVLQELTERFALTGPPEVEAEALSNTELIRITVQSSRPLLTADLANAVAEILVAESAQPIEDGSQSAKAILGAQLASIEADLLNARGAYADLLAENPADSEEVAAAQRSIETQQAAYTSLLREYEEVSAREAIQARRLSIIEPAQVPLEPFSPRPALNAALGGILGLAGGLGLAFLLENLDSKLYSVEEIEAAVDHPTLALIPRLEPAKNLEMLNGHGRAEDAFRRLRTNIRARTTETGLKSLLLTSPEPGAGTSTVAARLAESFVEAGHKVIVIDCDLRSPTMHNYFDLPNSAGLQSLLIEKQKPSEVLREVGSAGPRVITAGPLPQEPVEWLSLPEMRALLKQLKRNHDVVIVDAPALLRVSDAAILAPSVDGVLIVVSRANTRRESLMAATRQLRAVGANIVGVIAN